MEKFWEQKALSEMSSVEWEALCDGCGKCCLHKLEDEDTGDLYFTDVACKLLDLNTCRCQQYQKRKHLVSDCLMVRDMEMSQYEWLPSSCAYRLLAEGKPLFDWHPLISGDAQQMINAGISVAGRVLSENSIHPDEIETRIVYWVD